jgi:hypothetical protein
MLSGPVCHTAIESPWPSAATCAVVAFWPVAESEVGASQVGAAEAELQINSSPATETSEARLQQWIGRSSTRPYLTIVNFNVAVRECCRLELVAVSLSV